VAIYTTLKAYLGRDGATNLSTPNRKNNITNTLNSKLRCEHENDLRPYKSYRFEEGNRNAPGRDYMKLKSS
jgi:hypothetical protein